MGQQHWSTVLSLRMLARKLSPAPWEDASYLLNVYGNVDFLMRDSSGAIIEPEVICNGSLMPTRDDIIAVPPGITEQVDFVTRLDGRTLIIEDRTGCEFHFVLKQVGKFSIEARYSYVEEDNFPAIQEVEKQAYGFEYGARKVALNIYRGPAKCATSLMINSFRLEKSDAKP